MLRPSMADLVSKTDSYYSVVVGVAKRARQIALRAEENKESLTEKPVSIAVEELARGEYKIISSK